MNTLFLYEYGFPKYINRTMYTHSLNPYHLGAFRTYLVVIGDNNVPKENSLFKGSYIFILNCINIFVFLILCYTFKGIIF